MHEMGGHGSITQSTAPIHRLNTFPHWEQGQKRLPLLKLSNWFTLHTISRWEKSNDVRFILAGHIFSFTLGLFNSMWSEKKKWWRHISCSYSCRTMRQITQIFLFYFCFFLHFWFFIDYLGHWNEESLIYHWNPGLILKSIDDIFDTFHGTKY